MLEVKDVSAGYGGEDVVKQVSFRVEEGERFCIVGPNGCGKTTLLKAIAGILPFGGEIRIDGLSLHGMSRRELSRRVGMLSQSSSVYFSYTVWDTVMLGRYLHMKGGAFARPGPEDCRVVERCLEVVQLMDERDRDIAQLSGGQLQRVFLARTLAQEPQIILLDEPTNHLDLKYQVELMEYLKVWAAEDGHAVIGVMHDLNLTLQLADKLLMMKDGRVEACGDPAQVLQDRLLNRVYEIDVMAYMRTSLRRWDRLGRNMA